VFYDKQYVMEGKPIKDQMLEVLRLKRDNEKQRQSLQRNLVRLQQICEHEFEFHINIFDPCQTLRQYRCKVCGSTCIK
jgi:hypothetical protein